MAVFERIDLALVQELLRALTGMGSELQAVSFENQVAAPDTVPDAQISARARSAAAVMVRKALASMAKVAHRYFPA